MLYNRGANSGHGYFDARLSVIAGEVANLAALWETLELYLWNVLHRPGLADIADILVVADIVYKLLMLNRDTRGSAVL